MSEAVWWFSVGEGVHHVSRAVYARVEALFFPEPEGWTVDGYPVTRCRDRWGNTHRFLRTRTLVSYAFAEYLPLLRERFAEADLTGEVTWHAGDRAPDRVLTVHSIGDVPSGGLLPLRPGGAAQPPGEPGGPRRRPGAGGLASGARGHPLVRHPPRRTSGGPAAFPLPPRWMWNWAAPPRHGRIPGPRRPWREACWRPFAPGPARSTCSAWGACTSSPPSPRGPRTGAVTWGWGTCCRTSGSCRGATRTRRAPTSWTPQWPPSGAGWTRWCTTRGSRAATASSAATWEPAWGAGAEASGDATKLTPIPAPGERSRILGGGSHGLGSGGSRRGGLGLSGGDPGGLGSGGAAWSWRVPWWSELRST